MINKHITFNAYVASALGGQHGRAPDVPDASRIEPQSLERMRGEVDEFLASNATKLLGSGLSSAQIGQDFWVTRNGLCNGLSNGHGGSGFSALGRLGEELAEAAQAYGARGLQPMACGRLQYA